MSDDDDVYRRMQSFKAEHARELLGRYGAHGMGIRGRGEAHDLAFVFYVRRPSDAAAIPESLTLPSETGEPIAVATEVRCTEPAELEAEN